MFLALLLHAHDVASDCAIQHSASFSPFIAMAFASEFYGISLLALPILSSQKAAAIDTSLSLCNRNFHITVSMRFGNLNVFSRSAPFLNFSCSATGF
jgi:hypothetical protein